jgi:lysozyme
MKGFEKLAKLRKDGMVEAYMPTPNDRPTIGYGETNGVKMGMVWSREKAERNFTDRLDALGAKVWADVSRAPRTTQGQFDAICALVDNIGWGNWLTSSVRTNHLAGHNATAALSFPLWNKQRNARTGKLEVLAGLTRRRKAEAAIYRGEQ